MLQWVIQQKGKIKIFTLNTKNNFKPKDRHSSETEPRNTKNKVGGFPFVGCWSTNSDGTLLQTENKAEISYDSQRLLVVSSEYL